jgi:hypothetical protein
MLVLDTVPAEKEIEHHVIFVYVYACCCDRHNLFPSAHRTSCDDAITRLSKDMGPRVARCPTTDPFSETFESAESGLFCVRNEIRGCWILSIKFWFLTWRAPGLPLAYLHIWLVFALGNPGILYIFLLSQQQESSLAQLSLSTGHFSLIDARPRQAGPIDAFIREWKEGRKEGRYKANCHESVIRDNFRLKRGRL